MKSWVHFQSKPCALCASATLREWTALHGFPTADSGAVPYSLDGSTVSGTTIYGDITSDGSSFGRAGSGDLGGGINADTSLIIFSIIRRDLSISYEYTISAGGKHWAQLMASTDINAAAIYIGSWSSNYSDTIGLVGAGSGQTTTMCQSEYPPTEIDGILPQASGVWRTRTLAKAGRTITFTDGAGGPVAVTRCFIPVRGYVGLTLGPGVRIRNLTIS